MRKRILSFIMPGFLILSGVCGQSDLQVDARDDEVAGTLLIAGGALASTNSEIYNKFIELAGGAENAKIGIIPAASFNLKSSESFKRDLIAYGVKESNVDIIPISLYKPEWRNNSDDIEIAEKISSRTGIWFVGGDQCRITKVLYRNNGENTLALNALWKIYREGKVIAGTSAGAAIMSNIMIARGDSLGALNEGVTEIYPKSEHNEITPVYVTRGLGFFRYGIVDQHFDSRARLGRLISAAYEKGNKTQYAYGIDENTAVVVNNRAKTLEIVGEGGVTLIDIARAKKNRGKRLHIEDIFISYITRGDILNLESKKIEMHKAVIPEGKEYWNYPSIPVTGVMSANGNLRDFLSHDLIDNCGTEKVISYCFDSTGRGAELTFRKTVETKGYWGYKNGNINDYSFINVVLDIKPVDVTIRNPAVLDE